MSWKRLFFEKYLREELETYDPSNHSKSDLETKIKAGEDHVYSLVIRQFLSHENLDVIFKNLPNLSSFVSLNRVCVAMK